MHRTPKIPVMALMALITVSVANLALQVYSQKQQPAKKKQESFTRPNPTKPFKPQIPDADRYQEGKVFLERADSLYTVPSTGRMRQILMGNVVFRQGGMWMYCDSAYYYPEHNSMDAFGNVRMEQGDTLKGYADVVYYSGDTKLARMRKRGNAPVRLVNRNVKLTTDSLDYSLLQNLGWYDNNGVIDDGLNTLTSVRGRYSPTTKIAEFDDDVVLVNKKDGYTLTTEKLLYNTATHIASIDNPTRIEGQQDVILTTKGEYNTATDNAMLDARSTIFHTDTAGNVTTLEGDSILFDKQAHESRAYSFRAPGKDSRPVVLTDTAHSAVLIGGYAYYNDSTRMSIASDYPLLKEYSRGDTLLMRADTIRTRVMTRMVLPDSIRTALLNQLADSLSTVAAQEDSLFASRDDTDKGRPGQVVEQRQPSGPVTSSEIIRQTPTMGADELSRQGKPGTLTDQQQEYLARADSALYVPQEYYIAKAYRRARFFRPDIQGVADSLTFDQSDSLLYMNRRPVVWSGERQVMGNRITVHFNDSTADWVLLPDYGIMSEHVEDEFYNQLSGRRMLATFEGGELKRLEADGNVRTIFLPAESDSTYNKLINAESAYLTIDMRPGRKLGKLKMWPDVSGTVTPIFLVKKGNLYLPGFLTLDAIRPKREWYDDGTVRWVDELGLVPDELELFLSNPEPLSGRQTSTE